MSLLNHFTTFHNTAIVATVHVVVDWSIFIFGDFQVKKSCNYKLGEGGGYIGITLSVRLCRFVSGP